MTAPLVPDLSLAWTLDEALGAFSTPADRKEDRAVIPAFEFRRRSSDPISRGLMARLRDRSLIMYARKTPAGPYEEVPAHVFNYELEFNGIENSLIFFHEPPKKIFSIHILSPHSVPAPRTMDLRSFLLTKVGTESLKGSVADHAYAILKYYSPENLAPGAPSTILTAILRKLKEETGHEVLTSGTHPNITGVKKALARLFRWKKEWLESQSV